MFAEVLSTFYHENGVFNKFKDGFYNIIKRKKYINRKTLKKLCLLLRFFPCISVQIFFSQTNSSFEKSFNKFIKETISWIQLDNGVIRTIFADVLNT